MNRAGYSLVEVLVAGAVAAIGVAAAAVMVSTIVIQEEINAVVVRAANLQEQAVMLYRLDVTNAVGVAGLLPETCVVGNPTPAVGTFSINFSAETPITNTVSLDGGGSLDITNRLTTCTIVFGIPTQGDRPPDYRTNAVSIVLPAIRFQP